MKEIRIAVLDMNNGKENQGFPNILEICENFQNNAGGVSIETFDVRQKEEVPKVEDYDIFISSGGPGTPEREGHSWEQKWTDFLDGVWNFNEKNCDKKYLFLICHSFQLAAIHWKLGTVNRRKSYSFGVMPIHKTEAGEKEFLFHKLNEPFYGVDSRQYQFIQPDHEKLEKLGMKIVAIEKERPHIELERAVMAIRYSPEIFGTQFHPEANPDGMLRNLEEEKNREAMIRDYGEQKYIETLKQLADEDKISLTRSQILPAFLWMAAHQMRIYDLICTDD